MTYLLTDGCDEKALHAVERGNWTFLIFVVLDFDLVLSERLTRLGHHLDDVVNDDLTNTARTESRFCNA